jgi:2-polyprenyl-3-methyl-5-hydroxy-6-metoxy-1,4-benzoquinol methylase
LNKDFSFKETDQEGLETLNVLSEADNFNKWIYDTIAPFCSGNILEIGSGTGNISKYFFQNKQRICLSDIRENYCDLLKIKFKDQPTLIDIVNLDLVDKNFDVKYSSLLESFDTVFALNVVEHIEDDALAIENCKKLLKEGGTLIVLVPAYQGLYNNFDKELYHYRRYVKKSLSQIFKKNNFKNIRSRYFNAVGILGWFISGSLLKNKIIPSGQMKIYNKLVPIIKLVDMVLLNRIGLSVIVIGKK